MVLESTMICVDNSNFMRNGDFVPTRLLAQQDAVNLVCHSKTRSNPENNIGLLSLGNKVEVLATLTTDVGRVLSKLHKVECNGDINFLTGIRIAHLALKHRQGKNHKMRLVVFVGSPIAMDQQEIVQLGKRLKKEKVNVDVVSFGEDEANRDLLTAFINAINGKDGTSSHLVTVAANQAGPLLSDALVTSPIIQGEDGAGSSNVNFEFGVDPNDDPELALALRVSMEEQRHLQQDADSRRAGTVAVTPSEPAIPEMASEEALLERALAMSMEDHDTGSLQLAPGNEDLPDFAAMTEEEQIAFAMRMSAMETASESSGTASVQVTKDPKEEKEKKEDKKPKKEDEKMEVEEDEDKPS